MTNSLSGLASVLAFSSKDWTSDRELTWVYGIIVGWDSDSHEEIKKRFRFTDFQITLMDNLHADYVARMGMDLDFNIESIYKKKEDNA